MAITPHDCFTYTHTDIHLASSGELVEGQPLKLNCTVFGHTPKDNSKVKIHYWSSGESIANCSGDTTELPSPSSYVILTSICELSAHSTRSNSGDYSCSASIDDNNNIMVVSSEGVMLKVEPRIGWKTKTSAAVGSGTAVIVLALAIIISIIYYVKRRHRQDLGHAQNRPLGADGVVGEEAPLLGNADIRANGLSKG